MTPTKKSNTSEDAHQFTAIPQVVKEQTAQNKSEADYKHFQTEDGDGAHSKREETGENVNDRSSRIHQLPTTEDRQDDSGKTADRFSGPDNSYQRGAPQGSYPNDGGYDRNGDDDRNSDDDESTEEHVMRMIENVGGDKLTEAQKRELLQKFLTGRGNRYPYNIGDKK